MCVAGCVSFHPSKMINCTNNHIAQKLLLNLNAIKKLLVYNDAAKKCFHTTILLNNNRKKNLILNSKFLSRKMSSQQPQKKVAIINARLNRGQVTHLNYLF